MDLTEFEKDREFYVKTRILNGLCANGEFIASIAADPQRVVDFAEQIGNRFLEKYKVQDSWMVE